MLLLSQEIGKKFKIRVFPHFMDDFPSTNYRSLLSIVYRGYFQNKIKEIIIQSPACFCISDAMCDVYRKRYNYSEFFPLMNSVENYNERTNIKGSSLTKSKIIITYAGGLHLNRYETLMKFCQHLTNFPDILYELKIYTSERDWAFYKDKFTQFKDVSYGGFLKKCEIMSVICNSDILLHVESFDPFIQNYTMYSISTKIPEYLSSGNIIVAIGPKNIASISYLSINKVAYIIDNMNDSILFNDVIYKVLYSDNKELKANAKNLFLQKHLKSSNIDLLIRVFSINK
jgi:hypothetical protein